MSAGVPSDFAEQRGFTLTTRAIRNGMVWLLFVSGFLVFIEPAPFEVAFALVAIVFMVTGLRISLLFLPLILLLIGYNIGGGLSLISVIQNDKAVGFVLISIYMAIMAIVIACIFSEDTKRRLELMKSGYVIAAVIASIAAIMGYFDIAGTFDIFTLYGRATGTFKDPNVYSTFIVLPLVYLIQDFMLGTTRRPVFSALALLILMAGLFLSFSRGAWGVAVAAATMCVFLSFMTAPSSKTRGRIVLMTLVGLALSALLLVFALQFEGIRETFEIRASLNQSYDQGETGRFGNQRRSIPLLLDDPNGFGPLQFNQIFPEDPHNTFINAFAAYGWFGGICYAALIAITLLVGWRLVFQKTPWQRDSIAIWSSFFFLILQGLQIDTDHWRHFYVQLGLTWGLMVASLRYAAWQRASQGPTTGS